MLALLLCSVLATKSLFFSFFLSFWMAPGPYLNMFNVDSSVTVTPFRIGLTIWLTDQARSCLQRDRVEDHHQCHYETLMLLTERKTLSYLLMSSSGFTGVDQAYEPPPKPELVLRAGEQTVDECVHSIVSVLMDDVSTQNIYTYIYNILYWTRHCEWASGGVS